MKQANKHHIMARYSAVVLVMLLFAGCIVYELFKTAVTYAEEWNLKSKNILCDSTIIEPERGKILADNGTILAANLQFYTARIDWKTAGIKDDTLKKYLPALCDSLHAFDPSRTARQWKDELLRAQEKKKRAYRLFSLLSHHEYKRLKTFPYFNKKRNQTGLYGELKMLRCKPYGKMAARSIGSTGENIDSVWDSKRKKRIAISHGVHGHSGLEMALDPYLYGKPGLSERIQLTSNVVKGVKKAPERGYDITTTINIQLQDIVENELYNMLLESEAKWGTAVLMEVATGEIKAISNLEWNNNAGDYIEGSNHAVSGYEPGSVMKPISMMVALEDGVINNIDSKIVTGSVWNYCGRPIKDPHGGSALSPREIIETSSNIGMSKIVVKKYGNNPDGFRKRLEGMGFFDKFNMGIAGEKRPIFPQLGHTNADRVALTRMAFGYTTMIPPMYILGMYNAIANNGKFVRPHLVKKYSREGIDSIPAIDYVRKQVCSAENAQKLRIMLHDVVWGKRGTARKWVQSDLVEIAGKTGTAYTIENGSYGSQKRLAFCGFFPYEHPKYSCVVLMLGANRGAGASSGVVLKNIALRMYARGLLDNISDYRNDSIKTGVAKSPTLYATTSPTRHATIKKSLGIASHKTFKHAPMPAQGKMPNVVGLNVREAIARLERLGLTVRCSGSGYVAQQSVTAGSPCQHGQMVYLKLRH